jgi:hypothetical protein
MINKILKELKEFKDSFLNSGIDDKNGRSILRNAELYNLLGQDYEKIMEYGLGKNWAIFLIKESVKIVNEKLGTDYKEPIQINVLLIDVKRLYLENLKVKTRSGSGSGSETETQNVIGNETETTIKSV